MSAIAIVAFFALVAVPRASIPLIDGDIWWHIRAGETVLNTWAVPDVDTWSIVGAGMHWTSQDWLSNVVVALGDRLGLSGWVLLSVGFALLVATALVVGWRAVQLVDPEAGWLGRITWLAAGLTVAGPTLGVRVQVVDLPLAVASLWLLWRYRIDARVRWLVGLPIIALAWANLHAGWVLLFLLGGAVLVGEAVDGALGRRFEPQLTRAALWRLAAALVVSLAALVVNPNGLALYLYPLETATIAAHREFLAEWSPPDFGTLPGQLLAVFVVVGVVPTLLLAWRRMRLADGLVLVGLTVMAMSAARFLLVAGPIAAIIIAAYLDPVISRTRVGRSTGTALTRMERPARTAGTGRLNLGLVILMVLGGVLITLGRAGPTAQRQLIGQHMPVAAVDWINAHDPGERPFNQYSWGGYLGLYRPQYPIYIDGRSDIYGDAPIRRYAETVRLERDPQVVLDDDRIDYVLFDRDTPFAHWLDESAAWERVYGDDLAGVWVRSS